MMTNLSAERTEQQSMARGLMQTGPIDSGPTFWSCRYSGLQLKLLLSGSGG